MALTTIYNKALLEMAKGSLSFTNGSTAYKLLLLTKATSPTYTPVKSHQYLADVLTGGNNEVSGSGYTSGGKVATVSSVAETGASEIEITFADVQWPNSTITADAAILYRTGSNYADSRLVAFIDMQSTVSSSSSTFTVAFSTPLKLKN